MIGIQPRTKQDILNALTNPKTVQMDFWGGMAPERFVRPFREGWSAADTVRHLIKCTVPVTRALNLPRLVLRMLFGPGHSTSVSYCDLVRRYRAALAAGGKAGRFSPSPRRAPVDLAAWQQSLIDEYQSAVAALARSLEPWAEKDLDRYRLPHPLLGKLTLREMLFFALYHYEHHSAIVAERLGAFARRP